MVYVARGNVVVQVNVSMLLLFGLNVVGFPARVFGSGQISRESFLTQQSGQATVSPDHLLGASDGGEHLLLVSEEGGSDLVELGDVVHDEEDVTLAGRVGRLHADATGLAGVEISGSLLESGLGGAEVCSGGILLGGQLGLGLGQLSSEFG